MSSSKNAGRHPITEENFTLLDLLDRLLATGVVVRGDLTISVADVDLIYIQLNLLLTTVSKLAQPTLAQLAQGQPTITNKEPSAHVKS